jgi:diaminopimelate epimerase
MKLKFYKYEGAGNDFVMIDNRKRRFNPRQALVYALCHRQFGVGADGLILLESNNANGLIMRYFNADGYESTLCGNGGRCFALFAYHLQITDKFAVFNAMDGAHNAEILSIKKNSAIVKLKMSDVSEIETIDGLKRINTGSPHLIIPADNIEIIDVFSTGKKYRYDKKFSDRGVNVNFINWKIDHLEIRTYERGVENETLACGTGAVAAAIALLEEKTGITSPISISALGGELKVYVNKNCGYYQDIWLEGPAAMVFEGTIETSNL